DAVLAAHALYEDVQVEFAHTGDDCLACLGILAHAERWVFVAEFAEDFAHLVLLRATRRLHGYRDNRLRELDRLEQYWAVQIAERVAGERGLQTHRGND